MTYDELMFANTDEKNLTLDFIIAMFYDEYFINIFERYNGFGFLHENHMITAEDLAWRQCFLRVHKGFVDLIISKEKITDAKLKDFRRGGKYQYGSSKI